MITLKKIEILLWKKLHNSINLRWYLKKIINSKKMTMYKSVIALADKYNIPDEILDIIFMYINRNMIKSCTDKFMNKDFIRNIKRATIKSNNTMDMISPRRYNYGRIMLKFLYPQQLDMRLSPIENKLHNINKYKLNMLLWKSVDNGGYMGMWNYKPLHHIQDNQKVCVEIDELSMDEMSDQPERSFWHWHITNRGDIIDVLDHKNELDKVYNDLEPIKFKRNMKTHKYRDMLIPKISDYVPQ